MGPRGGPRAPQWVQGDPMGGSKGPPGIPWGSYGIQPRDPWAPPRDPKAPPGIPWDPPWDPRGPWGPQGVKKSKSGMNDHLIQQFELRICGIFYFFAPDSNLSSNHATMGSRSEL